jgi:transaldolase
MASNACQALNDPGESLCVDNINRDMLDSGTLQGYIDNLSVTGLTSYPTIFDHAISESATYDGEIQRQKGRGQSGEGLFFNLTAQDLARAAELFALVHSRTATVDGFVSLEVSPLLAGIDVAALASKLQSDDAKGFATSWNKLLAAIDAKIKGLCLMQGKECRRPPSPIRPRGRRLQLIIGR